MKQTVRTVNSSCTSRVGQGPISGHGVIQIVRIKVQMDGIDGLSIPLFGTNVYDEETQGLSATTTRLSDIFEELQVTQFGSTFMRQMGLFVWQAERERVTEGIGAEGPDAFEPASPAKWVSRVGKVLKSFSVGIAHSQDWNQDKSDAHHEAIAEWQSNGTCLGLG